MRRAWANPRLVGVAMKPDKLREAILAAYHERHERGARTWREDGFLFQDIIRAETFALLDTCDQTMRDYAIAYATTLLNLFGYNPKADLFVHLTPRVGGSYQVRVEIFVNQ
jgi:hypothetical protein